MTKFINKLENWVGLGIYPKEEFIQKTKISAVNGDQVFFRWELFKHLWYSSIVSRPLKLSIGCVPIALMQ
jgi:hypothetical protein